MAQHSFKVAFAFALGAIAPSALAANGNVDALEPIQAQLRLKNFNRAAELLEPLAAANNAQAELLLGNLYRQGLGVNIDASQARHWLMRAAEQGDGRAMYELATRLAEEEAPDQLLIQQWLQRAAKAGYGLAIEALRNNLIPQQFQPASLSDSSARHAAFWLAASHDDVTHLSAFNDTTLLKATDEFGRTALSYAARNGASHATEWLLQAGADPNQADSFGVTPLMLAAGSGQLAVLNQLVKSAAQGNAQDKSGNNALMYAIGRQHADGIDALLPVTDIKQRNAQGWSALDWAMRGDDNALVIRLRGMGLVSSRRASMASGKPAVPLQHSNGGDLYGNWPDVLIAGTRDGTELFDAVMQSNSSGLRGNEAALLLVAVQSDNNALIERLLMRGASVNADADETPLSWAVRHGKPGIAQKLLSGGIKPDTHGKSETAPLLDVARTHGPVALELVNALLKAGANPDSRDRQGRTALMIGAQAKEAPLVERLLQSGANSELSDHNNRTALMYAAMNGGEDLVRLLTTRKTAIDKRDNEGNTALMLAVAAGNADAATALIAASASTQGNKSGVTALMLAAAAGQDSVVKKLLSAGMKPDAQDRYGDTALIYAARNGRLTAVHALLAAGVDAGLRNNDHASALDIAERLAFKEVIAALAQRG